MNSAKRIFFILFALFVSLPPVFAMEITEEDGCRILRGTLFSGAMDRDIRYFVILPPGYGDDPECAYPVLYALHGANAPWDTWANMPSLRRALRDYPMIVAGFDGDPQSFYLDAPEQPESSFTTFFFEEFVPHVDKNHASDPNLRAVTGFSMGAFGAMHYMLTNPGAFNAISGLSGAYWDLTQPAGLALERLVPLLGAFEENRDRFTELDFALRLQELTEKGAALPPVYLHCGREDFLIGENRRMAGLLQDLGVDHLYRETSGAHNWPFWRDAAVEIIRFHAVEFREASLRSSMTVAPN